MLAVLLLPVFHAATIDPTSIRADESVWVYSHAGSPATDEFLRVWGVDGEAVPDKPGENEDYSFGYLSFDLSKLAAGKVTKATLILENVAPATYTPAQEKTAPLQARGLVGTFDPLSWSFELSHTVTPSSGKTVFGSGSSPDGKPTEIDIDLLAGGDSFSDSVSKAIQSPKHRLYLALTTGMTPSQSGSGGAGGVYKVYSAKCADIQKRPLLKLTVE